jgi:cell division protein FtsB
MNAWWDGTSLRRRVYLGLVLLLVAFAAGLAWDPKGLRHYRDLGHELARLDADNARLHGQVGTLQRRADALRGDARSLERAARESGFIGPDEVLFELR